MSQSGCSAETTEPYALRVVGDSMVPEFADGNIIIVDPALPVYQNAYVIIDYGGEVLFGQYKIEEQRQWLYYLNDEHAPVELIAAFDLKGVVVQRSTGRRKELKHYEPPKHLL